MNLQTAIPIAGSIVRGFSLQSRDADRRLF